MISVCMAVYNGEQFLDRQLASILSQLGADDELIVVNDRSTDSSRQIIDGYADSRITVLDNEKNLGPSHSFARALACSKGSPIFLADQDDIWHPSKVEVTCQVFCATGSLVIVSDARIIDSEENVIMDSLFQYRGSGEGFWKNLYKNGFVGCCMALDRRALEFLLPFPKQVGMHDEWIGLCASLAGRVKFLPHKLVDYRRHQRNVTGMSHGNMASMLRKRAKFLYLVLLRLPKIWRYRLL